MNLSFAETARINKKLAPKREVRCTTFDYCKTISVFIDGKAHASQWHNNLSGAKKFAAEYQKIHPDQHVKVVETKKKVHEFHIAEVTP